MKTLLISTYELGRQPFGLASPAAWLRRGGHEVACADLAVGMLAAAQVREAGLVAIHLPMHTATRLAAKVIEKVRSLNPRAHICCYGLYAPMNEGHLRGLGVGTILGGEFEAGLVSLADRLSRGDNGRQREPVVSLERLSFLTPDRTALPAVSRYPKLRVNGARKRVGYTEASRGCKHLCRHCPVVPVYQGRFRVVPVEVVMEDVRQQVAAGAEHITFGDPDFLNGPAHAARIARALHNEFPQVTFDVTAKVEHLLKHCDLLPLLRDAGCLFVTTAVESVEDRVLAKLDKGHTRQDFVDVVREFRSAGLVLSPTFIPFTPWTTRAGYRDLLEVLVALDLVESVSPIQLALRLLIPSGSRLLDLADIRDLVGPFDQAGLVYPWKHPDPAVDALAERILKLVWQEHKDGASRAQIFPKIWALAHDRPLPDNFDLMPRATIPYLEEPWYC